MATNITFHAGEHGSRMLPRGCGRTPGRGRLIGTRPFTPIPHPPCASRVFAIEQARSTQRSARRCSARRASRSGSRGSARAERCVSFRFPRPSAAVCPVPPIQYAHVFISVHSLRRPPNEPTPPYTRRSLLRTSGDITSTPLIIVSLRMGWMCGVWFV